MVVGKPWLTLEWYTREHRFSLCNFVVTFSPDFTSWTSFNTQGRQTTVLRWWRGHDVMTHALTVMYDSSTWSLFNNKITCESFRRDAWDVNKYRAAGDYNMKSDALTLPYWDIATIHYWHIIPCEIWSKSNNSVLRNIKSTEAECYKWIVRKKAWNTLKQVL